MKIALNKSLTLNWPKKDSKEGVDIFQLTEGQLSVELPEAVAEYILKMHKDSIINIDDKSKEKEKSVAEIVEEVKEEAPKKAEEYQAKKDGKEKEQEKNPGLDLRDLAKQA